MKSKPRTVDPTTRHDLEEKHAFECGNCLGPSPENGICTVCGTLPHNGDGWRADCKECDEVLLGDRRDNALHEMMMHRLKDCSEAVFEVRSL